MKRIAASALWLTYYVCVNPLVWLGYWIIELADWISDRVDSDYDYENPRTTDRLVFRLLRIGTALEAELHDWWFGRLVRTGFAATLIVSYLDEDGFDLPVFSCMTRWPWQRPFRQSYYAITYPEPVEDPYANKTWRKIAKQFEQQLV